MVTTTEGFSDAARAESAGTSTLKGNLSSFQLFLAVLAFNGPVIGIVAFAPVVIGYGNGIGAPTAFIGAAAIVALFAVGFLKMSSHVENPGGFYSFVTLGLGREVGLGASFLAFICYYSVLLASYALGGNLLHGFVTSTVGGPDVPWWLWAILLQIAVASLGFFNLDVSVRVLTVCMILEAVFIAAYELVIVLKGGASGLSATSFHLSSIKSGSVGLGLLFAMLCFSGFEVTAVFRDEVRNPKRAIPRAAFAFIAVVGVVYAASTWGIIQALGPAQAVAQTATDPTGAVLGTVQIYMGKVSLEVATALLCTSGFASLLGVHNVLSRYAFNLGADGILPKALGRPHPRLGSPHRASYLTSGLIAIGFLATVILGADPTLLYAQLSGTFGYALMMLLTLTTVAVVIYLGRVRPSDTTVWHRIIAPVLALIGLGVTLWLATSNISLLITAGHTAVVTSLGILYGSVVAGALYARVLKTRQPATFARIGRQ